MFGYFDQPYPAVESRKILITLLEQAGILSVFDKSYSFDRLFPNQDFHSGKGLGNLIALPFHKPAMEAGNSCFINKQSEPHQDQWNFLGSIKKVSVTHLDALYSSLYSGEDQVLPENHLGKLKIRLNNMIHLNRPGITPGLISFLKSELNFANSEYFIKKNSGKSTWGTKQYFKFIEETEHEVILPRGFIGKLIRYCRKQKIDFEFQDQRIKHELVEYTTNISLRSHQISAVETTSLKDIGIITAPPGSGKTVIGLQIIANKKQPALIIVNRKHLMDQWIERIQAFLGIPKNKIGKIGSGYAKAVMNKEGKNKPNKIITVAMIQSLGKYLQKQDADELNHSFGTIILDECHHIPAKTYRDTISKLSSYYQYGLTATPFRKGNDGKIIFIHLGEIIADIQPQEIEEYKRARIIIRETDFDIPYNSKIDAFETLSKVLIHDSTRNKLIIKDVTAELNNGKKTVIITERTDHIDSLCQFLKQSFEVITLSGVDSESSRKLKWDTLHSGQYQVLITTGQFFGEGTDLQNASRLFLVYPFSFKGKLIQYIGRVQRSEVTPVIYDYRDRKIDYLNRLFLKRNTFYRHLDKQATLFDDTATPQTPILKTLTIEKSIKVLIDQLDFRYGAIAFNFTVPKMKTDLEFEIKNDDVMPEFDVLKPYFSKFWKSKYVKVEIFAEFEEGVLVAQTASSIDLDNINQEIIESVKFRFINQGILGKKYSSETEGSFLGLNKLQGVQEEEPLYHSEEQLLNDLLKDEKVKHFKQLRYLSTKHDRIILKLRFVLNPFSFIFLLSGKEQYHVILETLDTEEATYIWHIEKNRKLLEQKLQTIDEHLNIIRNKGRQHFLKKQPENFSRIIHDYSDERKGFIVWKDQVEERLV